MPRAWTASQTLSCRLNCSSGPGCRATPLLKGSGSADPLFVTAEKKPCQVPKTIYTAPSRAFSALGSLHCPKLGLLSFSFLQNRILKSTLLVARRLGSK